MKIIIVGAGEVGFHIASRLALENKDVVVIDKDSKALKRISESIDVLSIEGSGSSPEILEEAGIHEAEILLAVTDSDEANLVSCLSANILSPSTKKLARIRGAEYDKYHDAFKTNAPGIDTVINPEIEVVKSIENFMSVPGALEVSEFADGRVKFIGIRIDEDSRLAGVKLIDISKISDGKRLLLAAVVRDEHLIVPRGNDRILAGDLVYFISETERLESDLSVFGNKVVPVKRVLIVGGGNIGLRLAQLLEKKSIKVKIIETDQVMCEKLSNTLGKTVVLHGDGTDQSLLIEENIQDVDVVVTLTGDDETNILISLLSKNMGVPNTITKISKFSYFSLMNSIGIKQVVSTRLSAIDTILQHIRKGKVLSAVSIHGEQAEVIEAVALDTSDIVGKPLSKLSFPKGSILIGIMHHDQIIIPSGESVVEAGDRVILFAERKVIPKLEKMLTVKLEFV